MSFMNKDLKIVKILLCILFAFLAVAVTMWLWNWLIPYLFNGPVITFWQALGLIILSKILFSGFSGKGGGCGCHHKAHGKHGFSEKLATMTPEDRERFKSLVREKWCTTTQNTSDAKSDTSNE
jgi:hypothetical protein